MTIEELKEKVNRYEQAKYGLEKWRQTETEVRALLSQQGNPDIVMLQLPGNRFEFAPFPARELFKAMQLKAEEIERELIEVGGELQFLDLK